MARAFAPGAATLLLGAGAREPALMALNRSGRLAGQDIIAFATHGLLAGEAGAPEPGLVLTPPGRATTADDGLLGASEIATLVLNARLVILSACNTAAGAGAGEDGLSGLARAFFHAGARGLMVTHWSVYSDAATRISSGLVDALARDPGLRPSEALRRTVLALLDDPRSSMLQRQPGYWAPFAIIGAD